MCVCNLGVQAAPSPSHTPLTGAGAGTKSSGFQPLNSIHIKDLISDSSSSRSASPTLTSEQTKRPPSTLLTSVSGIPPPSRPQASTSGLSSHRAPGEDSFTRVKNINIIQLGRYRIQSWYKNIRFTLYNNNYATYVRNVVSWLQGKPDSTPSYMPTSGKRISGRDFYFGWKFAHLTGLFLFLAIYLKIGLDINMQHSTRKLDSWYVCSICTVTLCCVGTSLLIPNT